METFEKVSLLKRQKMNLEEISKYYLELRKYESENGIPLKGIEIRKKIHILLLNIIKINRILNGQKIVLLDDKRTKTDRPIIFASTHIGGDDVQAAFEVIKTHGYLFLGDPVDIYQRIEGLLLYLNGVICLETRDKQDRQIAYKRAVELLNKNGNLLIFPEGAWNITPNLPVMGLYQGTVKMAKETGAIIVPLALEQYGKTFYANIGENLDITGADTSIEEANSILRDKLATLKWDIWEYQGVKKREEIPDDYESQFVDEIMGRSDFQYCVQDIYETKFKNKNIATPEEVFAFRKTLK